MAEHERHGTPLDIRMNSRLSPVEPAMSLTVLSSGLAGPNPHISNYGCNLFPPGFVCSHTITN